MLRLPHKKLLFYRNFPHRFCLGNQSIHRTHPLLESINFRTPPLNPSLSPAYTRDRPRDVDDSLEKVEHDYYVMVKCLCIDQNAHWPVIAPLEKKLHALLIYYVNSLQFCSSLLSWQSKVLSHR